jgi:DNA-binding transcriptional MerR regulator
VSERTAAAHYSIGDVARRTGLSEHVLRTWEHRYGAIVPHRSGGRHRRYAEHHIRRVQLLHAAQQHGCPLGDVARLSDPEIIRLLQDAPVDQHVVPLTRQAEDCERAIETLDPWRLTAILNRAAASHGSVAVADEIVGPVMRRIGERWADGDLGPHHEHLASTTVRAFLEAALSTQTMSQVAPVAVAATCSGEHHELGVLTAAVVAAAEGWRVAYLGSDIPASCLVQTIAVHRPSALLIGLTRQPVAAAVLHDLRHVVDAIDPATIVLCGGTGAQAARARIEELGAIVADLHGIRATLQVQYSADSANSAHYAAHVGLRPT